MLKDKKMHISTVCVHAGNHDDPLSGAIKPAISMSNIYRLPIDGSEPDWSGIESYIYARNGNYTQLQLEEKLSAIEGAESCVVLASGVAALAGTFFTFLKSGDHVICSAVCYTAVGKLFNELLPGKAGISVSWVDTTNLDEVKSAIRPETKLIHVETPGNPTTGISDIAAIAKIAHKNNAILSVDGTFASPLYQKPLDLGADVVIHSMTKYINGHGDCMGGAVLGSKELIDRIKLQAMVNVGGIMNPFPAWLLMRSLTTLPLRVRQHSENAMAAAKFLDSHPGISFVWYPGLENHPHHELAKRQMTGFSGMISFGIKADEKTAYKFLSNIELITHAVSLGDGESLMVYTGPNNPKMKNYPPQFHQGFFRFSVGLEDARDIINDLKTALDACGL